jgi:uncharacterized protein
MSERLTRRFLSLLLLLLLLTPLQSFCYAAPKGSRDPYLNMPNFGSITENGLTWKNSKTGFRAVIEDELDLLTAAEERKILDNMIPLTEYGSVAFWSTREESADVQTQAEEKRRALFGEESSCIVVINKAYQQLSIQSHGYFAKVVTSSRAGRIAARGSTDLTRGQTYNAVSEAFSQIGTLTGSSKAAAHLRVFCNLFLSLMIGLTLTSAFVLVRKSRADRA